VQSAATAVALQKYITSFAINGIPSGPGLPTFPMYGNESTILDLSTMNITQIMDPVAVQQCLWWQKELYV